MKLRKRKVTPLGLSLLVKKLSNSSLLIIDDPKKVQANVWLKQKQKKKKGKDKVDRDRGFKKKFQIN